MNATPNPEQLRLRDDTQRRANWKRWGPYLSERQWGTVREDYSADGDCWHYLPHDHARSRAYRWGEDGLLGFTDRECRLCFGLALWNENDPILKERLFGLTGPEGNHGEDVKELYYYLDSTPTHSYAKALYKYPQQAFPYDELVEANAKRSKHDPEYELIDTGLFDADRYFDVTAQYAKASPDDLLIQIDLTNHGPDTAPLHVLPTLWFRNTWVWGCTHEGCTLKPDMRLGDDGAIHLDHETLGKFRFAFDVEPHGNHPPVLFTDNETNQKRLFGVPNLTSHVKDAFHEHVVNGQPETVNPKQRGTKAAPWYRLNIPSGQTVTLRLRLFAEDQVPAESFGSSFERVFQQRRDEADAFYEALYHENMADDQALVCRQADAGLLWTKQFYYYVMEDWLAGDPNMPGPPQTRTHGRNADWPHVFCRDVLSMPDKWEYPWFAAWDLAFHMIPFARLDPTFAKEQLKLMLREWYMHPNGQIPAYEFAFGDVNPPVHAWACWRVYKLTGPKNKRDTEFLASTFQKLLMNFTWWVNRKDPSGSHVFSGGFLGLDNIGVFDRSQPLPNGGQLVQADATGWMAFYAATMLSMGLELGIESRAYADMASKFFEHFIAIADAMNTLGGTGLWDETDGFYYDQLLINGKAQPMRVRSLVGLLPLIAVEVLRQDRIEPTPGFRKRMSWFIRNRLDLGNVINNHRNDAFTGHQDRYLLSIASRDRLVRVLEYMLDEDEFLSPYGLRSLSKYHAQNPYTLQCNGDEHRVDYVPGESVSDLFGGNSNWRGPIWFPVNYLIIEALQKYHFFYGDDLKVQCPTGSGNWMNLQEVAIELERRLTSLFMINEQGHRPCHGSDSPYTDRPGFEDLVLFHEYFHGDSGAGLGASHQTGWTALVTRCFEYVSARQ